MCIPKFQYQCIIPILVTTCIYQIRDKRYLFPHFSCCIWSWSPNSTRLRTCITTWLHPHYSSWVKLSRRYVKYRGGLILTYFYIQCNQGLNISLKWLDWTVVYFSYCLWSLFFQSCVNTNRDVACGLLLCNIFLEVSIENVKYFFSNILFVFAYIHAYSGITIF